MSKNKWTLDPEHSELSFKIRHLMISNVSGHIKKFQIEAETEGEDFSSSSILLTAEMASISTGSEQRDDHLRDPDFFDVNSYPEARFQSTTIVMIDANSFLLHGNLTIKDISRPVELHVEFGGTLADPRRGVKAGFTVSGKINRSEWGLSFNRALETGGMGLGEEVRIFGEIELQKQPSEGV